MPPHARSKRPDSSPFIAGGHGEWSVTIMSMIPSRRPCHSASLVCAGADRRGALQQGGAAWDVFGGKVQIVRTGFDRDRQTFGARGPQVIQRKGGGEMDDVQAEAILAAETNHQTDGFQFGFVGSRGEISCIAAPVGIAAGFAWRVDRTG